jgi:hypothetical protein
MRPNKFQLTESVRKDAQAIDALYENIKISKIDAELLFEAADKYLGNAIAALNADRDPTETIPGSAEVLAGLILMAKDVNREAMNITPKKFDLVSQYTSDKESVKKFVAQKARDHGPSIIANIKAHVADPDRRNVLKRLLVRVQRVYSKTKQRARKSQDFAKVINA